MLDMSSGGPSVLLDEVLHSIFFLGKIHCPPYPPHRIVSDGEILEELKAIYPQPFDFYLTQVPKRSPLSCVLDMIVQVTRQETEEEEESKIIDRLQELISSLKENKATDLISSTICVSQNKRIPDSVRYYGVSMSTSGCFPGRIMVAASCLSTWDSYVAGAVMAYYPRRVKEYFDGTIQLQELVRCQAFSLSYKGKMDPCKSCENMFGLKTEKETEEKKKEWPYGNCAEVESLSKLLKNEKEVREQARPTSETYTEEKRKETEESLKKRLKELLRKMGFTCWDDEFYTPKQPDRSLLM
uniref:uncharacterized protein n=1 Tax=Semicossyphus pulcher TaxID=241346 RepID=UPI0037E7BCBC